MVQSSMRAPCEEAGRPASFHLPGRKVATARPIARRLIAANSLEATERDLRQEAAPG